jgi:uncharacterized membrane protein
MQWGDYIKYFSSLFADNFDFSKLICHRIPERTFQIKGKYFPVCSRCTGLYTGAILFYISTLFLFIEYSSIMILFAFIIITPLIIDGLTQYLGHRESTNLLRFLTGLGAGFGFAFLFLFVKITIF